MDLVEIKEDTGFVISLEYKKNGYHNALDKCLVRQEVLDRLYEASKYLPDNITFKIYDAYRPFALQEELYYAYKDAIIKEFNLEDLDEEEQNKIISQYVAYPKITKNSMPTHLTGGAIDVTLVYKDTKQELDMGCDFDAFTDLTSTMAFEKKGMDQNVKNNRRILYNAMQKAGFTNLESEYWHYDYGNLNWAKKTGNKPLYEVMACV